MTIREEIINNLQVGLSELDFVNKTFVWSARSITKADLPAIDIRDSEDDIEDANQSHRHNLKVEITLILEEEDIRQKALSFGKQILQKIKELDEELKIGEYVELLSTDMEIGQENGVFAIVNIELVVVYTTLKWEI